MKENKIDQLLEQIDDQLEMLHQDFTTAQTEKVQFELEHAKGYTDEEKIKLNQLDSKESYFYDQIYFLNEVLVQLKAWGVVKEELEKNKAKNISGYSFLLDKDQPDYEEKAELIDIALDYRFLTLPLIKMLI